MDHPERYSFMRISTVRVFSRSVFCIAGIVLACSSIGFADDKDTSTEPGQSAQKSTGSKSTSGKKPAPKAKKVRTKKRVQRLVVQQAFFKADDSVTDLTQRFQKAVQDDLLVVFVENSLSDDKRRPNGDLFLQVQFDGELIEQKVGHRKYFYLDGRDPPKIPQQGLAIIDAWYGTGIWGEDTMVDVKKELSGRISMNRIRIPVKDFVAGMPDPAFGVSKALIVRFAINGEVQTSLFDEYGTVELGLP